MIGQLLLVATLLSMAATIISFAIFSFFSFKAFLNISDRKRRVVSLIPILVLMENSYNENGILFYAKARKFGLLVFFMLSLTILLYTLL